MTEQKEIMTKLVEKLNKLNVEKQDAQEIENIVNGVVGQLDDLGTSKKLMLPEHIANSRYVG